MIHQTKKAPLERAADISERGGKKPAKEHKTYLQLLGGLLRVDGPSQVSHLRMQASAVGQRVCLYHLFSSGRAQPRLLPTSSGARRRSCFRN